MAGRSSSCIPRISRPLIELDRLTREDGKRAIGMGRPGLPSMSASGWVVIFAVGRWAVTGEPSHRRASDRGCARQIHRLVPQGGDHDD